jgi:hypothetical protein
MSGVRTHFKCLNIVQVELCVQNLVQSDTQIKLWFELSLSLSQIPGSKWIIISMKNFLVPPR